ncbi:hypothetical protein BCO26_1821 [Heyndrickxia coagulans 2-6]|nr:hypothetical protein BCO26_1821 [Heyndrickxia coagulans 2-6]
MRPSIRIEKFVEMAHKTDPAVKRETAVISIFRVPHLLIINAVTGTRIPFTSIYPVDSHCTVFAVTFKSFIICGMATFKSVWFKIATNAPSIMAATIFPLPCPSSTSRGTARLGASAGRFSPSVPVRRVSIFSGRAANPSSVFADTCVSAFSGGAGIVSISGTRLSRSGLSIFFFLPLFLNMRFRTRRTMTDKRT